MLNSSLNFAAIGLLLLIGIAAAVWEAFRNTPWVAVTVRFTLKSNSRFVCSFSGGVLGKGEPVQIENLVSDGSATEPLKRVDLRALG